jgi:drug/metabolite transporter (DMT)-like permease
VISMEWRLVALTSVCNTLGDVLNTAGMKREPEVTKLSLRTLLRMLARVVRNPLVIAGVLALTTGFFAMMSLLSIANVSFSVPATASSFVLETILAKYVLHEHVGLRRWAAATLVICGVALLQW